MLAGGPRAARLEFATLNPQLTSGEKAMWNATCTGFFVAVPETSRRASARLSDAGFSTKIFDCGKYSATSSQTAACVWVDVETTTTCGWCWAATAGRFLCTGTSLPRNVSVREGSESTAATTAAPGV